MRNPFRTEEEAFRFVMLTILYAGLIVAGSFINVWVGLGVFVVETAVIAWWVFGRGRRERPVAQVPPPHPAGERRILVIANETVGGRELLACIEKRAEGVREQVLVVTPALNSPLKHWTSDEDGAREDPQQAIEDALRTFAPDELIISTHPPDRSHWLERNVVESAKERFALPVTHVVVEGPPDPE